jgi:hypothetical protein
MYSVAAQARKLKHEKIYLLEKIWLNVYSSFYPFRYPKYGNFDTLETLFYFYSREKMGLHLRIA